MKYLEIDRWNRKEHFNFFSKFEEPFFGVSVDVDVTNVYSVSKDTKSSFYLNYLHKALIAANEIEPFRYRIDMKGRVEVYDFVDASATVLRDDETFGFSHIKYSRSFEKFEHFANTEIQRIKNTSGLDINVAPKNVIQFSALPWLNFTSMSHARSFSFRGSNPMISFGKVTKTNGERYMPVSIHVHHGLMDGLHVGQYVDLFQTLLNQ